MSMKIKKGQTYEFICNPKKYIDTENIEKIIFAFGEKQKIYNSSLSNEQDISIVDGKIKIQLSQEDTLYLDDSKIEYEMAIKFKNGTVIKTPVKTSKTLKTIIKEVI